MAIKITDYNKHSLINKIAGGTVAVGNPVYIDTADKFQHADNDGSGTKRPVGIAMNAAVSGERVTAAGQCVADGYAISSQAAGDQIYLSADPATTNGLSRTVTTTNGQQVVPVGIAESATQIRFNIGLHSIAAQTAGTSNANVA